MPEASAPVISAYPPAAANPLGSGPTAALTSAPAGGTAADQSAHLSAKSNDPAGADTVQLDQQVPAQGSWWSSLTLQLAEVVLGLIALLFGAAAVWTWRRQI
jgi:hypothetical protein